MNILILGGDGYLGWPTAMSLSKAGHTVTVVDNYLRRNLAREHNVEPLNENAPGLQQRCTKWEEISGCSITPIIGDLTEYDFMCEVFQHSQPDAIVHYAEQPSAPYSMMDHRTARLTLQNNVGVTFNLIHAVRNFAPKAHIVKLGTMGEYGTPNIDIEEGWLEVEHKGRKQKFLYPRAAGSLYHTTKVLDTDLLWFYVRMWDLKVTDLMQGPVYGIYTTENQGHDELLPHFSYDELFGTALNRFIVQAVIDYPLTVYGKGGQTRGYLNIKDTLNCIKIAIDNPADEGELRIFNQFVETFSVNDLANRVQEGGKALGLDVKINHMENPRRESEEHYYNPAHTGLMDLGLEPHILTQERLVEIMEWALSKKGQIAEHKIFRGTKWC